MGENSRVSSLPFRNQFPEIWGVKFSPLRTNLKRCGKGRKGDLEGKNDWCEAIIFRPTLKIRENAGSVTQLKQIYLKNALILNEHGKARVTLDIPAH